MNDRGERLVVEKSTGLDLHGQEFKREWRSLVPSID